MPGPKQPKTRTVPIRFTAMEIDALKVAARRAGLSVSAYIREVVVARAMRTIGEEQEER